jgi:hypothetical protein
MQTIRQFHASNNAQSRLPDRDAAPFTRRHPAAVLLVGVIAFGPVVLGAAAANAATAGSAATLPNPTSPAQPPASPDRKLAAPRITRGTIAPPAGTDPGMKIVKPPGTTDAMPVVQSPPGQPSVPK